MALSTRSQAEAERMHVVLADLAREMHGKSALGPDAVLQEITNRSVEVVEGVVSAGITLVKRRKIDRTVAPTDEVAKQFDYLQAQTGQGPCLDSAWQHRTVLVDDMLNDPRWPKLAKTVGEESPVRSSVSFELFTQADGMGALNLYADQPHAFTSDAVEVGYALAAHAALSFDAAQRRDQFESALASRDIIGQAKGMIMERFRVNAAQAFNLMTKLSQDSNVPVAKVARQLVESHDHEVK